MNEVTTHGTVPLGCLGYANEKQRANLGHTLHGAALGCYLDNVSTKLPSNLTLHHHGRRRKRAVARACEDRRVRIPTIPDCTCVWLQPSPHFPSFSYPTLRYCNCSLHHENEPMIHGICKLPSLTCMKKLADILSRAERIVVRTCMHNYPPFAVIKLATVVSAALPHWACTLDILKVLCT